MPYEYIPKDNISVDMSGNQDKIDMAKRNERRNMTDKLPQQIADEEATKENLADRAAMNKYVVEPVKSVGKSIYESVMGSKEANDASDKREAERAAKNPDGLEAKFRKAVGKKKGGTVSSASKRADGIAQRGKTRGKYC